MTLHIRTLGQGPDLVMLHGWGFNSAIWHELLPNLSQHFCVHLVDLPGHGQSPALGIEHDACAIGRLISKHVPDNAIYLGWSMGAIISLTLALQYPQQVKKLILVAGTPCFINHNHWQHGVETNTFEQFANDLQKNYAATIKRFLTLQSLGHANQRARIKTLYTMLCQQPQPNTAALNAGLTLLKNTDIRDACSSIQQSTLLIHSDDDKLVPLAAGRYLESTLPQAQFCLLEKTGHIPFIHQPDIFCQHVIDFCHE